VVVLDQHAVIEAEAMVRAAAARHGVLLEEAQIGRGLTRVEDHRPVRLHRLDESRGQRGDAAHPLHEIEGGAFRRQDRGRLALDRQDRAAGFNRLAVRHDDRHAQLRVDAGQHRARHRASRHAARLARQDLAGRARRRVHQRQRRRIALAHVLGQRRLDRGHRPRVIHHIAHRHRSSPLTLSSAARTGTRPARRPNGPHTPPAIAPAPLRPR